MSDDRRFGDCVIEKRIFQGPTRELHLARQSPPGRQVWILCLREHVPRQSPFADRLRREAELLAQATHDHIIVLLQVVDSEQGLWLVLQHSPGVTLEQLLLAVAVGGEQRLPALAVASLGAQLAQALSHLHHLGWLHGSLDPNEIWISEQGRVRVGGLSSAVSLIEPEPSASTTPATGAYESPEQVQGEVLTAASDQFALGCVLHHALTGAHPFGIQDEERPRRIRLDPPEPLLDPEATPPPLVEAVQRCLDKQPDHRFANVEQLSFQLLSLFPDPSVHTLEQALCQGLQQLRLIANGHEPGARPREQQRAAQRLQEVDRKAQRARKGVQRSMWGLVATAGVGLTMGVLWFGRGPRQPDTRAVPPTARSVESAGLIVVARPWAHVFVDGEQRETTPFATPIPLTPGVHYLRLEHPGAPPVRRKLELVPGERRVLEFTLDVQGTALDAGAPRMGADAGP